MAHSRNYTLSETTEKQLRQRGLSLVCIRCARGKPVTILGEESTPDQTTTIQYSMHEE